MKKISTEEIKEKIKELYLDLCITADEKLENLLIKFRDNENNKGAKETLDLMLKNFKVAKEERLPICQDTGMAIIFIDIGQEVMLSGPYLEDMINEGVREAYQEAYLRKSIVNDPLKRENTTDNTPAIIHTRIVPGERIKITAIAKGFGSENTSALKMLKPADGKEGVVNFILQTLKKAIPNGCAPLIVGIGIGGDFESSALNSKKALSLPLDYKNPDPFYDDLQKEILEKANQTGIGPMGLGGKASVLKVNIIPQATHIAGLPVAVNVCCYVERSREIIID